MKKFNVVVELEISDAHMASILDANKSWTIESEVKKTFEYFRFAVKDVRTYNESEA